MAITAAQGLGAAGDLFGGIASGIGSFAEAKGYKKAAKYAAQNAILAREAGDIKLAQTERQIFKVIGAQKAGYAAAGLTGGGSAQAILRDSLSQGALEKAIVNQQAQIDVNSYLSQSEQFKAMAKASKAAGIGSIIGGVLSAGAMLFSDDRLKTNKIMVGNINGFNIYDYDIFGQRQRGVLVSEIAVRAPYALGPKVEGYQTVDYGLLGLSYLLTEEGQGRA